MFVKFEENDIIYGNLSLILIGIKCFVSQKHKMRESIEEDEQTFSYLQISFLPPFEGNCNLKTTPFSVKDCFNRSATIDACSVIEFDRASRDAAPGGRK